MSFRRTIRPAALLGAIAMSALVTAGCGGSSDSSTSAGAPSDSGSTKLALVAYSTPQVAYDPITAAFQKTPAGKGVSFTSSYGPSGDQSRAVVAGQPADVVAFSLSPDMNKLVDAKIVSPDWDKTPSKGNVTTSVVTFVVRKGNPKNIRTWADLVKPGIKVLTPNPLTSGSAKWNLLAAYGANGGLTSEAQGLAYIKKLLGNVVAQDKSGAAALQNFTSGNGDVLISYENEALTAQKKGQSVDYVTPDDTIKIENPIAATLTSKHQAQAKAFVDYALSDAGQKIFASWGYRPVDPTVLKENAAKFPVPSGLFTVDQLGGWSKLNDTLFDPDNGKITKLEENAGASAG